MYSGLFSLDADFPEFYEWPPNFGNVTHVKFSIIWIMNF